VLHDAPLSHWIGGDQRVARRRINLMSDPIDPSIDPQTATPSLKPQAAARLYLDRPKAIQKQRKTSIFPTSTPNPLASWNYGRL